MFFIDSMQFMNCSLSALAKNLSENDFKHLSQEFTGDLLKLVKQKGVYPYEYVSSFLKDKCISEKDYSHATNVWNVFKMNTMGDNHDLYLKTDVPLLADVS